MRARTHLPFILFMSCAINVCAQNPVVTAPADTQHNLMPVPASARFNAGKLIIDKSFTFSTTDQNDARLQSGVDRMLHRLEGRTVLELGRTPVKDAATATLVIIAAGPGKAVPSVDENESYS